MVINLDANRLPLGIIAYDLLRKVVSPRELTDPVLKFCV